MDKEAFNYSRQQNSCDDEVEALNRDIEESENQIEQGFFFTHEQVVKMSDEWASRKRNL